MAELHPRTDATRHTYATEPHLLPATEWAVAECKPTEWRDVAEYLMGLLRREPLKSGVSWAAERIILGCLANELLIEANAAGAGDAKPMDLTPTKPELEQYLAGVGAGGAV